VSSTSFSSRLDDGNRQTDDDDDDGDVYRPSPPTSTIIQLQPAVRHLGLIMVVLHSTQMKLLCRYLDPTLAWFCACETADRGWLGRRFWLSVTGWRAVDRVRVTGRPAGAPRLQAQRPGGRLPVERPTARRLRDRLRRGSPRQRWPPGDGRCRRRSSCYNGCSYSRCRLEQSKTDSGQWLTEVTDTSAGILQLSLSSLYNQPASLSTRTLLCAPSLH